MGMLFNCGVPTVLFYIQLSWPLTHLGHVPECLASRCFSRPFMLKAVRTPVRTTLLPSAGLVLAFLVWWYKHQWVLLWYLRCSLAEHIARIGSLYFQLLESVNCDRCDVPFARGFPTWLINMKWAISAIPSYEKDLRRLKLVPFVRICLVSE